ncbi:MAG: hypothetical protein ABI743_11780 [bacterium]
MTRLSRVLPFAMLALVLALPVTGCPKKTDTTGEKPETTGGETPADDPFGSSKPFMDQGLAILDDALIPMATVFTLPEQRSEILNMRNSHIEMGLAKAEFDTRGLKLTDEDIEASLQRLYDQMPPSGLNGESQRDSFVKQQLEPQGLSEEQFRSTVLTSQLMMQKILLAEYPMLDEDYQTTFEKVPKAAWFAQFGTKFGWKSEADVTLAQVKPYVEEIALQDLMGQHREELTKKWGKEARDKGRLKINRLPNELLPDDTASADPAAPKAAIIQAPPAGPDYKPDPVAYVLDGKDITWEEIFVTFPAQKSLKAVTWAVVQSQIAELLWKEAGLTLTPEEVSRNHDTIMEALGDEASRAERVAQNNTTIEEMEPTFARIGRLQKLISNEFPVTDADVKKEYDARKPAEWAQMLASQGIKSEADATLEKLTPIIRQHLEAENGGPKLKGWLIGKSHDLADKGRLKVNDKWVDFPEVEPAPQEMTLPGGPDGSMPQLPEGMNPGEQDPNAAPTVGGGGE